jgi:hypothetical protein
MTDASGEKRLVFRVLAHWRELRAERPMPAPREMTAADLGADEAFSFALSIPTEGGAPRFTHIGAVFGETVDDLLGRALADCPPETVLAAATSCMGELLDRRVPICIGGLARHMGRPVLFRSILLPLSSDEQRIDAVVGAANFRMIEGSVGLEPR